MSKYRDIKSYNLAIKIRTNKTVLVEGITDKNVISNFFLVKNFSDNVDCRCTIDVVSIISNEPELTTLGNRQRIIHISNKLSKNNKLGYLIDREWDNVDFNNLDAPLPTTLTEKTFVTRGHSIENYWFSCDAIISFLQNAFPTFISDSFLRNLQEHFPSIILFSAAFSLAAKDGSVISRLDDLLEHTDIETLATGFILKDDFNTKLLGRQSNFDIVKACNDQLTALQGKSCETLRWICHGHLGEQAIRACVACLALTSGVNASAICEIERGEKPVKFRHDSKHITTYSRDAVAPLNDLLSWVREANVNV